MATASCAYFNGHGWHFDIGELRRFLVEKQFIAQIWSIDVPVNTSWISAQHEILDERPHKSRCQIIDFIIIASRCGWVESRYRKCCRRCVETYLEHWIFLRRGWPILTAIATQGTCYWKLVGHCVAVGVGTHVESSDCVWLQTWSIFEIIAVSDDVSAVLTVAALSIKIVNLNYQNVSISRRSYQLSCNPTRPNIP